VAFSLKDSEQRLAFYSVSPLYTFEITRLATTVAVDSGSGGFTPIVLVLKGQCMISSCLLIDLD
jgi:hypothetical protein